MKQFISVLFLLAYIVSSWANQLPFKKGVNLTSWFQTSNIRQVQFRKYTKQDFINIKSLGCDVIRLPINLHAMTSGTPDYTIDPLFFELMDNIVDWAEELEIHLILDNHTFDQAVSTDPKIENALIPVWTQIAGHYKNRSHYIYYEVLNEPHGIADATWNNIQQNVIDAIRLVDENHTIIIGGSNWNSYNNLQNLPVYADTNLIYTFHFYEPFLFTHQGASWTDPSLASLAGIPFPYKAGQMPGLPAEFVGTWVQSAYNNYNSEGTIASIQQELDIAITFKNNRNVPLYCGEFGVYRLNSDNDQRVNWYSDISDYLSSNGIGWTIWDYQGAFGLFEAGTNEFFDYDLNIPLVEALSLDAPEQSEYVKLPDTSSFNIFQDYIEIGLIEASEAGQGIVDYYSRDIPFEGEYCIYWTGVNQYDNIGFNFRPIKDISDLVVNDYAVDMMVRGDTDTARFDIRFIDTKTSDPDDHPWRMNFRIDSTYGPWDGEWHHVQIPLSAFAEQGSWDDAWFPPQGDFDWTETAYFQIVAESHNLQNIKFWFDDIKVIKPGSTVGLKHKSSHELTFRLYQNYPNPFNPETCIRYQLSSNTKVTLTVFDITGKAIDRFINQYQNAGEHYFTFNAGSMSSGVYIYSLSTSDGYSYSRKMILIK